MTKISIDVRDKSIAARALLNISELFQVKHLNWRNPNVDYTTPHYYLLALHKSHPFHANIWYIGVGNGTIGYPRCNAYGQSAQDF